MILKSKLGLDIQYDLPKIEKYDIKDFNETNLINFLKVIILNYEN
jgi:hypothetical protein